MIYALVHYPGIDTVRINQLRKEYDPEVGLIEPHITIVFPLPDSVGEQPLVSHIDRYLMLRWERLAKMPMGFVEPRAKRNDWIWITRA